MQYSRTTIFLALTLLSGTLMPASEVGTEITETSHASLAPESTSSPEEQAETGAVEAEIPSFLDKPLEALQMRTQQLWRFLHSQPKRESRTHERAETLKIARTESNEHVSREPDMVDRALETVIRTAKNLWVTYGWGTPATPTDTESVS